MELANANTSDKSATARTRDAILQGALEEFAAFGFDGSTTRGIAARAGMSHGLIRHYFKSKERLWFEAVEHLLAQMETEAGVTTEQAAQMLSGDRRAVRAFMHRYVHYCARHPEYARIIFQATVDHSDRLRTITENNWRADLPGMIFVIKGLIGHGIFPETSNPISVLYAFVSACQNIFALSEEARLSFGYDVLSDKAIEAHATTVMDIFCPLLPDS